MHRKLLDSIEKGNSWIPVNHSRPFIALLTAIFCIPLLHADERKIDPTFLYRDTSAVKASNSDLTTAGCHYKPLFGQGDSDTSVVVGVARYGEAILDPRGACATVQYPNEDQVYVVLDGNGTVNYGNEIVPLVRRTISTCPQPFRTP